MSELLRFAPLFCTALFVATFAVLEAGRRIGAARLATDPEGALAGVGAVETAVFALLGLLIAFTFSGAASRFDERRQLIVEETNRIGTAWLRLDLLPGDQRARVRALFRTYVDSRLETYRKRLNIEAAEMEVTHTARLQEEIWRATVDTIRSSDLPPTVGMLVLPAMNDMFDIRSTRIRATLMHPPSIIFAMLTALTLTAATLVGYGMARGRSRNWLHIVGFAVTMTLTVYVIVDLEYPRLGLIRVDAADEALMELREAMQ